MICPKCGNKLQEYPSIVMGQPGNLFCQACQMLFFGMGNMTQEQLNDAYTKPHDNFFEQMLKDTFEQSSRTFKWADETHTLNWEKLKEDLERMSRKSYYASKKDIPPDQWHKMWEGNFDPTSESEVPKYSKEPPTKKVPVGAAEPHEKPDKWVVYLGSGVSGAGVFTYEHFTRMFDVDKNLLLNGVFDSKKAAYEALHTAQRQIARGLSNWMATGREQ